MLRICNRAPFQFSATTVRMRAKTISVRRTGSPSYKSGCCFCTHPKQMIVAAGEETEYRGYYFFKAGSWERIRFQRVAAIARPPVFSPRGDIFAAVFEPGSVMINESKTGRPLARLRIADDPNCHPLTFLESSQKLAIAGTRDVYLCNLSRISESLQNLALPWDVSIEIRPIDHVVDSKLPGVSSTHSLMPKPIVLMLEEAQ